MYTHTYSYTDTHTFIHTHTHRQTLNSSREGKTVSVDKLDRGSVVIRSDGIRQPR